jgi:hypothetical protein
MFEHVEPPDSWSVSTIDACGVASSSRVDAVAVVWFVARAVETAMLSRAQVAVTTQA